MKRGHSALRIGSLIREMLAATGWMVPVAAVAALCVAGAGFNLLLSRAQPYSKADLDEADALCRELGLGELLQRMPAGLEQWVGDTGWALSHGERSRVYLARALLQNADIVVLDESLAALDPLQLRQCLHCITRRPATILLIANT